MKKANRPYVPPLGSPNARAKDLNEIARKREFPIDNLPENEQAYVKCVRWTLGRYWRREITIDQAKAEQRWHQIIYLQAGR